MDSLMLLLAKITPKKILLETLEEVIQEYKQQKTEDSWERLSTTCLLIVTSVQMKNKTVEQAEQEINEIQNLHQLLNPNKIKQQ